MAFNHSCTSEAVEGRGDPTISKEAQRLGHRDKVRAQIRGRESGTG